MKKDSTQKQQPKAETESSISLNMCTLKSRLSALISALSSQLVERDIPVRLALLAALSGEHLLLIGPPGTSKSLIARRLRLAFREATYFEHLLTRFSVPEELFGPLSVKGLEEDRYERLTDSYLPTASVAFLDEIFKANSAILNSLLTLLNEREFDNGARRTRTPLIAAVGASNELPDSEELNALFDRFLLRVHVGPVTQAGFRTLLQLRGDLNIIIPDELQLSASDLNKIRQAAQETSVPPEVENLLSDLRDWCAAESIPVSDRRWRKAVKLLQTSAMTNGRASVSVWDCWLLQFCLWNKPEEQEKIADWYGRRVGTSAVVSPDGLAKLIGEYEARLKKDTATLVQAKDASGRPIYLDEQGNETTRPRPEPMQPDGAAPSPGTGGSPSLYSLAEEFLRSLPAALKGKNGAGLTKEQLDKAAQFFKIAAVLNGKSVNDWDDFLAKLKQGMSQPSPASPAPSPAAPADYPPKMVPAPQPYEYVQSILTQIQSFQETVQQYREQLNAHAAGLEEAVHSHLWVTSDFEEPARRSLEGTRRTVDELEERLKQLYDGFSAIPTEQK